MTQKDKELLLKDLCGRLPYQPLCRYIDIEYDFCQCDAPLGYCLDDLVNNKIIIKPYLRPMYSMTEEEFKEHSNHMNVNPILWFHYELDWLNKKMFDYRGLIEKGLALEASERIYNN